MSKQDMLQAGIRLVDKFVLANDLPPVRVDMVPASEWRFGKTCAYYRKDVITMCLERCGQIGRGGPAWSYPGYIADRTPYGVMAHELGHHVDYHRSEVKGPYWGEFSQEMRRRSGEARLTSYCPNDAEWFAEMFRLFCTNPDLLRRIRPETHLEMIAAGLKPVEQRFWHVVLKNAPDRTLQMAGRRIMEATP